MSLSDWVEETRYRYESDDYNTIRATEASLSELWVGFWRKAGRQINYGQPIWHRGDWDILVILDACTHDLFQQVADSNEFDWLDADDLDKHHSVASQSLEFMRKTFDTDEYADELSRTSLVCANPFTRKIHDRANYFEDFNEIWHSDWDDEFGNVKPETVTQRAYTTWNETDAEQMIAWYMQPHAPFRAHPDWSDGRLKENIGYSSKHEYDIWKQVRRGWLDEQEVRDAYRDNLVYALEAVENLLGNLEDETVVITSDHGNALGENLVWSHPEYVPMPILKTVPWVEIEATAVDSNDTNPTLDTKESEESEEVTDEEVRQRLKNLGYA